jgi:hypothetical protein|tara:strand:- start:81 stop:386 length:306 start_codon:yes stop_codon:yes gene_type:complete
MVNRKKITEHVMNELTKFGETRFVGTRDFEHVVSIGVSIIETKYPEIGPGYGGGGFVNAVINNELMESFARADKTNVKYLEFYCELLKTSDVLFEKLVTDY